MADHKYPGAGNMNGIGIGCRLSAGRCDGWVQGECGDGEWDEFVWNSEDAHHEQTAAWGELQRQRGWAPMRVVVRRDGRLVAGAQILCRTVKSVAKVGYLRRGPVAVEEDPDLRQFLVRAIVRAARHVKLTYLAVVPPYSGGPLMPVLADHGFFEKPSVWPPSVPEDATTCVDLAGSLDEVLARMRTTTRRYIRQGLRRGLRVRQGSREDLPVFGELLHALCKRRGARPNIDTEEFLRRMWDQFAPYDRMRIFVVENGTRAIASLIVLTSGIWARAWRIGWSGEYAELRPTETLYWETMRWAKANGYKKFDFMGVNAEAALARLRGEALPESPVSGLAEFKMGFGGTLLAREPRLCALPHPVLSTLMKIGGKRWIRTGFAQSFAARLLSKFSSMAE